MHIYVSNLPLTPAHLSCCITLSRVNLRWCYAMLSCFSRVRLCATPQTAAHQALPSLGSSSQEYWSGLPFLLQCMKVKSEKEVAQSCTTPSDPMDCSLPGSSVHGIFQARVLEWGAIAFSDLRWYEALKGGWFVHDRNFFFFFFSQSGGQKSGISFIKPLISFMRALTHDRISSQEPHFLILSHSGWKLQHTNWWAEVVNNHLAHNRYED